MNMADELTHWRNCSSCKKAIGFKQKYFDCSVSTCQGKRTGYVFCSIFCWERHLPGAKHRDAGAIEKLSPSKDEWLHELANGDGSITRARAASASNIHTEVLVVVSKMKTYIKEVADMNTSGDVADILSDRIREACDKAINNARADGRKTVMARDFEK